MAAVLCNGIGDLCKALSTGLEKVICLPCKACGIGCEWVCDTVSSPFFLFIAVALGCNIPPLVWAFSGYATNDGGQGCRTGLIWLLVNAALNAVNILAAFYISKKIREQSQDESIMAQGGTVYARQEEGKANSMNRISHILCYDKMVAIYILFVVVFVIWQTVGMKNVFNLDGCAVRGFVLNSVICGYMFLSLAVVSFICSICCIKLRGGH